MYKPNYELTSKNVGHLNALCDRAEMVLGWVMSDSEIGAELGVVTVEEMEKLLKELRGEK